MLFAHDSGGFMEVAPTLVISKSGPGRENLVFLFVSQRFNAWVGFQEFLEVRDDGLDLCLLEHDFGNPHSIGIRILSPGQLAPILSIPLQKARSEFFSGNRKIHIAIIH